MERRECRVVRPSVHEVSRISGEMTVGEGCWKLGSSGEDERVLLPHPRLPCLRDILELLQHLNMVSPRRISSLLFLLLSLHLPPNTV